MILLRSAAPFLSLFALIVTAIGAFVILFRYLELQREEKEELGPPDSPQARLAQLERAYYAGQMDEAEFLRIKAVLGEVEPSEKSS